MLRKLRKFLSKLSVKVFLSLLLCIVLPMCVMFTYMRYRFEEYIQESLSDRIIQNISSSEQEIYSVLQNMSNISSVLTLDEKLMAIMQEEEASAYEKTVVFDDIVREISINNLSMIPDMKLTFLDLSGNVYSNWELNYNDYSFLMQQDWVRDSFTQNGHIVWSMFSPGYMIRPGGGQEENYISMARAMNDSLTGRAVGTAIISIGQSEFSKILDQFSYAENDSSYVGIDGGTILLKNEGGTHISEEHITGILQQMEGQQRGRRIDTYEGKRYLVSYYTISEPWTFDGQRLRVVHYTDYQNVVGQMDVLSRQINVSMAVFVLILVLIIAFISFNIVRPVRILARKMGRYSIGGDLDGLDMQRQDEIGHLNRAFGRMSNRIQELFSNLQREHEVREKYHFEALRAQVNPHFLFNTLTMIRWMAAARQADNIVSSIDALANMMRYSMNRDVEAVSLEEELDNIRSYVYIQNCRFGDRYQVKIQMDEELLDCRVIKFILQPIVENAVIHAFPEDKGTIWIYGEEDGDTLRIYVEDNGTGITPEVVERFQREKEQHRSEKKVTGIGLSNVGERIRVEYGPDYGIAIENAQGQGTRVIYTLPVIRKEEDHEKGHDRG